MAQTKYEKRRKVLNMEEKRLDFWLNFHPKNVGIDLSETETVKHKIQVHTETIAKLKAKLGDD